MDGKIIKSSKYPSMGMKSGIMSMGDKAYATVKPAIIFAIMGVSFFFIAMNTAGISVFSFLACSFRFTL